MTWKLVITGCGTSHGNPPWGMPEYWSEDPRDFRRRSGAMVFGPDGEVILIDLGPDLNAQLRDPHKQWDGKCYPTNAVVRCDGVLLTHTHADHCHGTNELRHLNRLMDGEGIPIHGLQHHLDELKQMFSYCFGSGPEAYTMANPSLTAVPVTPFEPFTIAGLTITAFPMQHGTAGITAGFRFNNVGYLTDFTELSPDAHSHLRGLDLLVLDMLREKPHNTHLCWDGAEKLIAELAPKRTVLTHMGYQTRFAEWEHRLPEGVEMATDGLTLPFR